jgi:hypothetical protein
MGVNDKEATMNTITGRRVQYEKAENFWLAQLNGPSLAEKMRRIGHGLRQPRQSGEFRYACRELQRLMAFAAALLIPSLTVIVMVACIHPRPDKPDEFVWTMTLQPQAAEETPPLIEPPPTTDPTLTGDINDTAMEASQAAAAAVEIASIPQSGAVLNNASPFSMPVPTALNPPRGPAFSFLPPSIIKRINISQNPPQTAADAMVLRALRWLKGCQEPGGGWHTASGGGKTQFDGAAPAMTGLALLAFLGHGETPASPEFGTTVRRAIEWLMAHQTAEGRFTGSDEHEYSLPIAAYALCEAAAMTRRPDVRAAAARSIEVIIRGQNEAGLWDYGCIKGKRNDVSYGGWCAQALKAADMAGLPNPELKTSLHRAAQGFRNTHISEGVFGYTLTDQESPEAMTGVSVLCLQLLGAPRDAALRQGLRRVGEGTVEWEKPVPSNPLYAWYYQTQARFHEGGSVWSQWQNHFEKELGQHQTVLRGAGKDPAGKAFDTGYWPAAAAGEYCQSRVYNTTLCALMLEVPYRYLPTYQSAAIPPEPLAFANELEVTVQ